MRRSLRSAPADGPSRSTCVLWWPGLLCGEVDAGSKEKATPDRAGLRGPGSSAPHPGTGLGSPPAGVRSGRGAASNCFL